MKFKQSELKEPQQNAEKVGEMNSDLYNSFIDLIQFEIDKINLVYSGKLYFDNKGLCGYAKFLNYILMKCEANKDCIIRFLLSAKENIPEFVVPEIKVDFEDNIDVFKLLAKKEDEYDAKLINLISMAFDNRDWKVFGYLLEKVSKVDHLCSKALSAVENNATITDLIKCELPTSAKS